MNEKWTSKDVMAEVFGTIPRTESGEALSKVFRVELNDFVLGLIRQGQEIANKYKKCTEYAHEHYIPEGVKLDPRVERSELAKEIMERWGDSPEERAAVKVIVDMVLGLNVF